ncbi:PspC domain-containing protein [Erythrobacter litoralis]|uniref:PspC domain-containing protein n=1 Tax=Erythrobacter litoralis TaxID=39960 RepID=UPI002434B434|nr:PspC domain-containing protein [Erythrobacter litoralis]MDG6078673.1 PspC domain-containing protein [Erythrobacter litoralis]
MSDIKFRDRETTPSKSRKFRLDKRNGKLGGVCAGISDYFGLDVTMIRIVFVLGTLIGFGSLLLIYLAIWLIAD